MARICTECALLPCYVSPKGYCYKKCTKCISKRNKANRLKKIEVYREKAKVTKERLRREAGARLRAEMAANAREKEKAAQLRREHRKHDAHVRRYKNATRHEWLYMSDEGKKEYIAKQKERRHKQIENASEPYVRRLLAQHSFLTRKEIPHELVMLKQAQIRIINHLKQSTKEIGK